jgi:hypothetical protein
MPERADVMTTLRTGAIAEWLRRRFCLLHQASLGPSRRGDL